MDKVKVILAVLKKQHFWVMSGTVLLVGLIGWFLATSTLWANYKSDRGKIEKEFDELRQITSQERENQAWIDGIQEEAKKLKVKVREAWELVYAEQQETVLKWPKTLDKRFLDIVPTLAATEEIPRDLREHYWNYVKEEFPRLLEIVDARSYLDKDDPLQPTRNPRTPPMGPGARRPKASEPEVKPAREYKVVWNARNQADLAERLDWKNTPSTQEVRQTQEDLWVYQALLTIIAHLNDRAKGHHDAKIKEISALMIGQAAATEFQAGMAEGRIEIPEDSSGQPLVSAAAPGGEAGAPHASAPIVNPYGQPHGETGTAGEGLDEGRYVDGKGMPLGAGATAPPEFKRMPVVMRLLMDEREISRLLVECANSPLPVEVRQFRIHTGATGAAGPGAPRPSSGPRSGGAATGPYGGMRFNAGGARPRGPARAGADEDLDRSPYDVTVELQGIIYIFNPPDASKLADAAPSDTAPDGTAPADAAPAADQPPDGAVPADAAEVQAEEAQPEKNPAAGPADAAGADAEEAPEAPAEDDNPGGPGAEPRAADDSAEAETMPEN